MGFSWSSCVAQETLLTICEDGGLRSECVLAHDASLPRSLKTVFAVATDDLMIFSDAGPELTVRAAEQVESAMVRNGIATNPDKDVDDALNTTCVGVNLVEGKQWRAPPGKLWLLLDGVLDLCGTRRASPGGVAAFMGMTQWYDLLHRLQLSVFARTYDFSAGEKAKDWVKQPLDSVIAIELLADRVLALFCAVDMTLPFLPCVAATDASTEFGHGGAIARASVAEVKEIARLACKSGGHVQLDGGEELSAALAARLGPRHVTCLTVHDFTAIFSIRVHHPRHINLEEADALIRYVRWVLRSKSRFCHRLVVLVDSKVVIGAVAKGRSSSASLNALVRRLAALCCAGGILLHCIFIPTSHNPSDWPSRGLRIPGKRHRSQPVTRCPACGAVPKDHPLDVPRRERGQGQFCRGLGPRWAWRDGTWVSQADADLGRFIEVNHRRWTLRGCFEAWRAMGPF